MKIFIWERLDKISDNYHEGGGLLVIAEDLEDAKKVCAEDKNIVINEQPDSEFEVNTQDKKYFIFPNSGCC